MQEEKIKAAIVQMQKRFNEYIEEGRSAKCLETYLLYAGKAEGMEKALGILKEVSE